MKGKRNWISVDSDALDATPYLIKIDRDGAMIGYQYASLSGVIDVYSDQAFAEFTDEEPDTLTIYRLGDVGPIVCKVSFIRHDNAGLTQVQVAWTIPGVRGKAGRKSESGFYRIPGA